MRNVIAYFRYALLVVLLVAAQLESIAHRFEHDAVTHDTDACEFCLASLALDHSNPGAGSNLSVLPAGTSQSLSELRQSYDQSVIRRPTARGPPPALSA